ncbi:hypothetical protein P9112_011306 [Eukaryota sp. TZLM1-RC]
MCGLFSNIDISQVKSYRPKPKRSYFDKYTFGDLSKVKQFIPRPSCIDFSCDISDMQALLRKLTHDTESLTTFLHSVSTSVLTDEDLLKVFSAILSPAISKSFKLPIIASMYPALSCHFDKGIACKTLLFSTISNTLSYVSTPDTSLHAPILALLINLTNDRENFAFPDEGLFWSEFSRLVYLYYKHNPTNLHSILKPLEELVIKAPINHIEPFSSLFRSFFGLLVFRNMDKEKLKLNSKISLKITDFLYLKPQLLIITKFLEIFVDESYSNFISKEHRLVLNSKLPDLLSFLIGQKFFTNQSFNFNFWKYVTNEKISLYPDSFGFLVYSIYINGQLSTNLELIEEYFDNVYQEYLNDEIESSAVNQSLEYLIDVFLTLSLKKQFKSVFSMFGRHLYSKYNSNSYPKLLFFETNK